MDIIGALYVGVGKVESRVEVQSGRAGLFQIEIYSTFLTYSYSGDIRVVERLVGPYR